MKPSSGSDAFATKPSSRPRSDLIAVTTGEPAGIGPELCLSLAGSPWAGRIVVIGDPDLMEARARALGSDVQIRELAAGRRPEAGTLLVRPVPLAKIPEFGKPLCVNAGSLIGTLEHAVAGCLDGSYAAMVTGPLHKAVINDAGIPFSGHTEFIAALTATETPVMMLVADSLRVALATTHLPLRAVADRLSTGLVENVIRIVERDLRERFGVADPEITVCGLNPHAGEGGYLGSEDAEVIAPAVAACRRDGLRVRGPLPADTAFTPAAGHADAVVAMYHDQGLPVAKFASFGHAVNVTLGLPIIRTSVDHGTAFDLAGSGNADPGSLLAAVRLAADLAG